MMGLKTKFFVVIFILNGVLASGLYLFLTLNFEQSFSNYLNQRELRVLELFSGQLEQLYEEQGSWQFFSDDPSLWTRFTFQSLAKDLWHKERLSRNKHSNFTPPSDLSSPPSTKLRERILRSRKWPEIPIVLLDNDKNVIVGTFQKESQPDEDSLEKALKINGKTIGYLSIPTRPGTRDYLDNEFAKDQSKNLIFILAGVILFAIISAFMLSLFLIKRITKLVEHVKLLNSGNYDTSTSLGGNDELNTLANHLSDLGSTLKENSQIRKQWVADISHELRTPVAILQADLEAIEDGVRDLNQKSVVRLQNHVGRLRNLINDLYDLSLTDSGSLTYQKNPFQLNDLLEESTQLMKEKFDEKKIIFSYQNNSKHLGTILGDYQRLLQLMLNILQNSLKYTDSDEQHPGAVQIELHTEQKNGLVFSIITINDSAPGVSAELLPRLTDRLFRVDISRSRDTGGAGLGLAICKNIVEAHNGTIELKSSSLGGLSTVITFPLSK